MDKISIERGKRLEEAINYLISIGRIKTQKDFAEAVECTPTQVSKAKKGSVKAMTTNFIKKVLAGFEGVFNEEYLLDGVGDLVKTNPENKNLKLGDQRYIENLEAELREAKAKINLQFQLIESLKRQIEMLEEKSKDTDVWKQVVSNYHQHFDQENKKDKVSVG